MRWQPASNAWRKPVTAERSTRPPATFNLSSRLGPIYFFEIAKLRAARLLWAQAVAAFDPADPNSCRMHLHVRTSRLNKSVCDPYTNLLRVTTEAMSAAIGGCDTLTVEPFGFEAHLALNLQRILAEEAHLNAVADPAGGSYYIEALTASLAREAWKLFQKIESEGGYSAGIGLRLAGQHGCQDPSSPREGRLVAAPDAGWRQQLSQPEREGSGAAARIR